MNNDNPAPEVSVVLPIYNEEACIDGVLDELCAVLDASLGRSYEVLAVDDGSSDRTPERLRAQAARRSNLRMLRLTPNAGQSTAFCATASATPSFSSRPTNTVPPEPPDFGSV